MIVLKLKEKFDSQGIIFIPALLKDLLPSLVESANQLAEKSEKEVWHYYEENSQSKVLNRSEYFIKPGFPFYELTLNKNLYSMLENLLDDEPVLFKEKINYKFPGNKGFEEHQDIQAGWLKYTRLFITVGIAIDAQVTGNGGLEFIFNNFNRKMIGSEWQPLTPEQTRGFMYEPVPCNPGDVLFFDSYVPHRSHSNRTNSPARILYLTYNRRRDGNFRNEYYADKLKSFPPNYLREKNKNYKFKV